MLKKLLKKLVVVSLFLLIGLAMLSFTATTPSNLGVTDGRLAPCPDKPNCVSTQAPSEDHRMAPVPFTGAATDVTATIKTVLGADGVRATLVEEQNSNYLRYEFRSRIFGFVDDVEFYIDDSLNLIHFRSASRVGYSDMGANTARMSKISSALNSALSNL